MSKIFLGILVFSICMKSHAQIMKFRDPEILLVQGKALVTLADGKKAPAKNKMMLKERASIETDKNSWIYLSLAKNEKVLLAPESKMNIPVIAIEDGAVERIELVKGQMRVVNMTSHPRLITTPLTRDSYAEADLAFNYDDKKPAVKLSVLDGHAVFRGEENEDQVALSSNDEASFVGKTENGTLVIDVLLQGRKVVRGQLQEKMSMNPETRNFWNEPFERFEKIAKSSKKKDQKEKKMVGGICQKPQGRLDDCAWTCVNNPKSEKNRCRVDLPKVKCVRTRCDANGNWSDPTDLIPKQSPCTAKASVRRCDY